MEIKLYFLKVLSLVAGVLLKAFNL